MTVGRHKARTVKLEPNKRRILESLLYLVGEAVKRNTIATQYTLVKSLFLADRSHLNTYGRPVTFDNYVAMNHGPVPSFAYSLLRDEVDFKKAFGLSKVPWTKIKSSTIKNAFEFSKPIRKADLDVLSESDVEALSTALTIVSGLSFPQLRKLTHQDAAYVDAWEDEGGRNAYPMSYGLLFDAPDFDQAENLEYASKLA